MSVVGSVVAHALIRSAVDAAIVKSSSGNKNWRSEAIKEVVDYYMRFVIGVIEDDYERRWIENEKIMPMVCTKTDRQLYKLLLMRNKNDKAAKKNKPFREAPISDKTIIGYHDEYALFLKKRKAEIELEKRRKEAESNLRLQKAQEAARRRAHIEEYGESDADLASKLF